MSTRLELPSRRPNTTHKVHIAGATLYLTIGFYDDDKKIPGELFMILDKAGEAERILIDSLARMTSVAIQYGAPLEVIMRQWLGLKGKVRGPVFGDDDIKFAESALDYVAKHILYKYCGWTDLRSKGTEHG